LTNASMSGSAGLDPAAPPIQRVVLRSTEFRKGREATWRELDELVGRVERRGIHAISADELERLPLLYRAALSSLSVARSIALDRNLLRYLDALSLRAYLVVYGPRANLLSALGGFFRRDFPAAVRGTGRHLALAFAAFLIGLVVGFMLVNSDEAWYDALVPDDLSGGRGPSVTAEQLRTTELFAPWPGFKDAFVVFANYLFRHNSLVAILSFGLGFLAGIPTLLLMAYQGVVLGALAAIHYRRGLLVDFIGWTSMHGVTEIGAISLCGAGGLVVAEKLLFPGRLSRLESLAVHGKQAATMVGGAIGMLFIAGLIEGGFRQLIEATPARFTIAAIIAALWLAYFALAGRGSREARRIGSQH
jgi:uncharacterized membrane protein SpoIIM required for sporulation